MRPIPPHAGRSGLVDHDLALRHRALGWFQVGLLASLVLYFALAWIMGGGVRPRMLVFPLVNLAGLLVQRRLWAKGMDVPAGHLLVVNLLLATSAGIAANGVGAPVVLVPVVTTFMAGYLLGARAGRIYALVGVCLLWSGYGLQVGGWIGGEPAPVAVWLRVYIVLGLVAVQSLLFLAIGLRSARRLRDREAESLERSLADLRERRNLLRSQVRARTADLEKANLELSEFARAVSHDLRGPLRAVRGYLDVLRDEDPVRSGSEAFSRLRERCSKVEALLETALGRSGRGGGA